MFIYIIYMYLNVNVIVNVYIYIYNITQPTPKFTKHTWREQIDRHVNIPPHPKPLKKTKKMILLSVAWGQRWVL